MVDTDAKRISDVEKGAGEISLTTRHKSKERKRAQGHGSRGRAAGPTVRSTAARAEAGTWDDVKRHRAP